MFDRFRQVLRRTWGQVRWKIATIIVFTAISTILVGSLGLAALNVVVRRESANVVEKQIEMLLQTSRSVAPAILDHAGPCTGSPGNASELKPLLAYTEEAFPQAQAYLMVDGPRTVRFLPLGPFPDTDRLPDWLPAADFSGLVVDQGQVEIRHVVTRQKDTCKVKAIFSLPLGSELARRLSSAAAMTVTAVSPGPLRVHSPIEHVLRTVEGNFVPGMSRTAAVVLTARDWETGAREDWMTYSVVPSYWATFEGVARLGSQLANWVWLGAALLLMALLMDASGVWICVGLGATIAAAVDELSRGARQIAAGNFAWRTPVRSRDQLGDLSAHFNEMAIALERLKREEAAALKVESDLQAARTVQEYLFPRVAPVLRGATVFGRTLPARTVGGDLYDFFDLGNQRIGILCTDVSGKGIPAALMMANLQALARAYIGERLDHPAESPSRFVEILNQQLTGRFGDNRYATLFWAEYDADTSVLRWVNAGNPSAILTGPGGEIDRLESDGFPIGMFASARFSAREVKMAAGSRLVIFSDGVTDAQNAAEGEFGEERLIALCRTIPRGIDAQGATETLMEAVAQWSTGTEHFDDTTVVVLAR